MQKGRCDECGKTFALCKYNPRKKFCSKECNGKNWKKNNRKKVNLSIDKWHKKHPENRKENQKRYIDSHPWYKTLLNILGRCYYNKNSWYFKKNIPVCLTAQELKKIWFRDKAYKMDKPSIHRIDSKLGYNYNNCCYIELYDNQTRRKERCL